MAIQIRRREIHINAWQRGCMATRATGAVAGKCWRLPPGKDNVHE
jgi:hypothetical protein